MNILQVIGYLARDPEERQTQNGVKMTKLVVADNVTKDDVIWWQCYVFGESHDKIIAYLKKGSAAIIIGEMRKSKIYQKKDGTNEVSNEMLVFQIKFSPFKSKIAQDGSESNNTNPTGRGAQNERYANTDQGNGFNRQSCAQNGRELLF